MGKNIDLVGKRFDRLEVLRRSDRRGPRGKRTTPLWECRCECGAITYKATDSLTRPGKKMCRACAGKNSAAAAQRGAGFVNGTQLSKICDMKVSAANTSGVRGVYYERRTGRWRARIVFQQKIFSLGSYGSFEEALEARREGERRFFGEALAAAGLSLKETEIETLEEK